MAAIALGRIGIAQSCAHRAHIAGIIERSRGLLASRLIENQRVGAGVASRGSSGSMLFGPSRAPYPKKSRRRRAWVPSDLPAVIQNLKIFSEEARR